MFIENAVAAGDSSLDVLAVALQSGRKEELDIVLVYDNEKRNKDIVRQMKDAIKLGYRIVLWPDDIEGKDINEMVKDHGYTKEQVFEIINKNVYVGLSAELRFMTWKKC